MCRFASALRIAAGLIAGGAPTALGQSGDFLRIEGKHPHFGGAKGATVIQLHGQGPSTIELVQKPTP